MKIAQYFTLSSVCSVNREGEVLSKQLRFYHGNCGFNLLGIKRVLHVMPLCLPLVSCLLLHYQLSIRGKNVQKHNFKKNVLLINQIWHVIIRKGDLGKKKELCDSIRERKRDRMKGEQN